MSILVYNIGYITYSVRLRLWFSGVWHLLGGYRRFGETYVTDGSSFKFLRNVDYFIAFTVSQRKRPECQFKRKFILMEAMKAREKLEVASLNLNLDIRWSWVVIYTFRLLYLRRKSWGTDWTGGWVMDVSKMYKQIACTCIWNLTAFYPVFLPIA
jgi:hypothetical protein